MNGISFAEFENSSFDTLYRSGFANAKHMDEMKKELGQLKPGDWMQALQPSEPSQLGPKGGFEPTRALQPAGDVQTRQKALATHAASATSAAAHAQPPMSLNDMGVLPGNTQVDPGAHAWRPSQEAHARAQHAPAPQRAEAPRAAPSSNQGAFVGWRSN
mmetsp:Transcript_15939/g.29974  ORF Transcript_15939/g.29974 Transcript_15939/m.29974 type:complete len:159 (+) Transcript_15939:61-537(+)